MVELDPTPVTVLTHSDLALAEHPFHSDRRDVSLMDKLLIEGNGPLSGEIRVPGAKNATLSVMYVALLTAEPLALSNVPDLQDVRTMFKPLRQMGVEGVLDGHNLTLNAVTIRTPEASYDLVKAMHASILALGPPLARFGHARVLLPGGCGIGARPVDQHIKGLRLMGAEIVIEHGYIGAGLADGVKRLRDTRIVTDMMTVTGTENLLMAAALTDGETVLENAACEPEVTDLANLLVKMGTRIEGIGTNRLVIQGTETLHGAAHTVIADRIEAGTFLCAAAAAGGNVMLRAVPPGILDAVLDKLREAGVTLTAGDDWIRVQMTGRSKAVSFRTLEYPAFLTDVQAQFMMLNAIAGGSATVTGIIFENRLMHVQELNRLGVNIVIEGKTVVVTGVEQLSGATAMITNLRASANLVIVGLIAQGKMLVDRIYHLDRGYDRIEDKLSAVGTKIRRIQG